MLQYDYNYSKRKSVNISIDISLPHIVAMLKACKSLEVLVITLPEAEKPPKLSPHINFPKLKTLTINIEGPYVEHILSWLSLPEIASLHLHHHGHCSPQEITTGIAVILFLPLQEFEADPI